MNTTVKSLGYSKRGAAAKLDWREARHFSEDARRSTRRWAKRELARAVRRGARSAIEEQS